MKRFDQLLVALCLLGVAGTLTAADNEDDEPRGIYGGVKGLGFFSDSDSGLRVVYSIGGVLGWEFPRRFAVEGEITAPVESGSIDPGTVDGEWEIRTGALYGVWRSPGEAYFKARLGWAWRDVDADPDFDDRSGEDDGASAGLGFGFDITRRARLEWEATWLDPDYYSISFGVLF